MTPSRVPVKEKRRGRIGDILLVLVIIGVAVAAAMFQEPIGFFFKLRMWDSGAPARAVKALVAALQARDRDKAAAFTGGTEIEPLKRGGKWVGYHITGLGFKNDMEFADLAPAGAPEPTKTEFSFQEGGNAQLRIKNAHGQAVLYTLKLFGDGWKVITIRVGA
jgi:hypothetical protein